MKWLGIGDKPWKMFFTFIKAKQQREMMSVLLNNDNKCIKDEDKIFQEVADFYGKLFLIAGESKEGLAACLECLQFTTSRVTEEQRVAIQGILNGEEICKTLQSFPKGKEGSTIGWYDGRSPNSQQELHTIWLHLYGPTLMEQQQPTTHHKIKSDEGGP